MRIKELYATFGSLDNKKLSLKNGLNIIYGRNEAGKSTWGAFIRAMLYGISTREKARIGYIPDKERYLPWNGNPMYGKCTLISGEDEISIERTSGKSGVFSKVEAKNLSRGGSAPTGEELCGIARGVYDRCAFIGQAKLNVDRDADTEKKILSLASSGEETVSAREVISRLEKNQKLIRSPRGLGSLCELEKEIAKKTADIEYAKSTSEELSRTEESIEVYSQKEKELSRAIKIAEAEEKKNARAFYMRTMQELSAAEQKASSCAALPQKADLEIFSQMREQLRTAELSAADARSRLAEHTRTYENAERETAGSLFSGMSAELAAEKAKKDTELCSACRKGSSPVPAIVLLSLFVLSELGAAILYTLDMRRIFAVAAIFALLFAAPGVVLLISSVKKKHILRSLADAYGAADKETVSLALTSYLNASERLKSAEKAVIDAKAELSAAAHREEDTGAIIAFLRKFGIASDNISEGETELRSKADMREEAETAFREAQIRAEALKHTQAENEEPIEYTEAEIPKLSANELFAGLEETASVRKSLEMNAAALRERISGFDATRAEKELFSLSRKAAALSLSFDAYSLAAKCISEADAELSERFSPEVEKRTAEIFSALTGGNFQVVRIRNRDFDMDVATGVASARRDGLYLSRGTLDELYFSLRLALCDLILPEKGSPPIVLDDAFVNFDDERLSRALMLLKKLSEKRQIILFSCHGREAAFFETDKEVNIVNL